MNDELGATVTVQIDNGDGYFTKQEVVVYGKTEAVRTLLDNTMAVGATVTTLFAQALNDYLGKRAAAETETA